MADMTVWQRWIRQPRSTRLRKLLFQVHLWIGLALGLYIVMLSVTGSALVYRRQLTTIFTTRSWTIVPTGRPLSQTELTDAALRVYSGYRVTRVDIDKEPDAAASIELEREGGTLLRYFDPYTGEDLGDVVPKGVYALIWLASLHDDLLFGHTGRLVNGVGSLFVTLLAMTGAILWWRGIRTWRRGLGLTRRASWTTFNWDLHSALGFWTLAFTIVWGVSGVYLAFPTPFSMAADWIQPYDENGLEPRKVDLVLEWLPRLHFGRFRTAPAIQALWAIVGLAPAIMFVTGALMWWNRVMRKRVTRESPAGAPGLSRREQLLDDVAAGG
jgi:uncharacterized iron-regulated membrane protein